MQLGTMLFHPDPLVASLDLALFSPNAWVDAVFYNVGCLAPGEIEALAHLGKRQGEPLGTLVRVAPDLPGERPRIRVLIDKDWQDRADEFLDGVDTIVVAGVGSSILGTAALAKDVADRLGKPVAGVVTGFGASGTLLDGLVGWTWYTPLNGLDQFLMSVEHGSTIPAEIDRRFLDLEGSFIGPWAPDEMLPRLLKRPNIVRAIGHSRGSLQLGMAVLTARAELADRAEAGNPVRVGTLGAVAALPQFVEPSQILGEADWLGRSVSMFILATRQYLPGRSHTLNPALVDLLPISLENDVWGKFGARSAFS